MRRRVIFQCPQGTNFPRPLTTDEQEVKNVEKCLAAGYEKVILCSPEIKTLTSVRALVSEKLSNSDQAKILFLHRRNCFTT